MTRASLVLVAVAALMPVAAFAFPDGAPWEALAHRGEACASCHFGSPPVQNSGALVLEGAAGPFITGETYPLTLRFTPEDAQVAGFLVYFHRTDGTGGSVAAGEGVEAKGAEARSVAGRPVPAAWTFAWTAPRSPGPVTLRIAANAGNDDASPLGDVVHLKTLALEVRGSVR